MNLQILKIDTANDWQQVREGFKMFLLNRKGHSATPKSKRSMVSGTLSRIRKLAKYLFITEAEFYLLRDDELLTRFWDFIEIVGDEDKKYYTVMLAFRKYLEFKNIEVAPIRKMTGRKKETQQILPEISAALTPINELNTTEGACEELPIRAFRSKSGHIYLRIG